MSLVFWIMLGVLFFGILFTFLLKQKLVSIEGVVIKIEEASNLLRERKKLFTIKTDDGKNHLVGSRYPYESIDYLDRVMIVYDDNHNVCHMDNFTETTTKDGNIIFEEKTQYWRNIVSIKKIKEIEPTDLLPKMKTDLPMPADTKPPKNESDGTKKGPMDIGGGYY